MEHVHRISKALSLPWHPLTWALAGPLALGALAGLRFSGQAMLLSAAGLTAIFIGTVAMMGPALHLLLALLGAPISGGHLRNHLAQALGAAGRVHVGFAPAAFFLCATAALREMGALLVLVCLVVGVMVGAFQLLRGLAKEMTWRTAAPLVATWSLVALIVGGRLSLDLLTFTLHGA